MVTYLDPGASDEGGEWEVGEHFFKNQQYLKMDWLWGIREREMQRLTACFSTWEMGRIILPFTEMVNK